MASWALNKVNQARRKRGQKPYGSLAQVPKSKGGFFKKAIKFVKKHKKKFAIVGAIAVAGVVGLGVAGKLGGFKRLKTVFSKGKGLIKKIGRRKTNPPMSALAPVAPPRVGSSIRAVQKQEAYVSTMDRQAAKEDNIGIKTFDTVTFGKFKRGT